MRVTAVWRTGLTITNPLVQYRALLATKRIDPDPAQHRLALHLQKLYEELIDYEPIVEYNHRLNQISRALGSTPAQPTQDDPSPTSTSRDGGVFSSLFAQKREKEEQNKSLTRVLTDHEEAIQMTSPRGLMLHGEVGTGKSMLIDLFADCLPNRKKKRWHFTTFMLEVLSKLEHLRRSRQTIIPSSLGQSDDYSLLWLARDMISTSPILFLDEFQLPDRAASKIMTNLMTSFFHLGGVLIATSNRMPEELAKAAGMEFAAAPPPSRLDSVKWRLGLGSDMSRKRGGLHGAGSDFANFLDVLRARCEVWQMEGGKDYRRREAEQTSQEPIGEEAEHILKTQGFEGLEEMAPGNVGLGYEQSRTLADEARTEKPASNASVLPKQYLTKPSATASTDDHTSFTANLQAAEGLAFPRPKSLPIDWTPSHITVYKRQVPIPRQHDGVAHFTFSELCLTSLGPADYITLASTYHTLILTDVPILTLLHKNEARRFITLLDALYEARCKLLITADAGPDDIFFPEQHARKGGKAGEETIAQDQILSETIAEVYQDATAPFRPNISSYDPGASAPEEPDVTHARLAGILSDDQLEDGPPNKPHRARSSETGMGRGDSIFGLDTAESQSLDSLRQSIGKQRSGPNFQDAGIFTGEDEKFAYKRARSRLWEMCGKRWWERDGDWWNPLGKEVRRWERGIDESLGHQSMTGSAAMPSSTLSANAEGMVGESELDESADKAIFNWGKNVDPSNRRPEAVEEARKAAAAAKSPNEQPITSPFRTSTEPPPKIPWTHMWGFMRWGKKAGAWGKGVEGLEEREQERKRRKEQPAVQPRSDDSGTKPDR